jgi:hypothetical protein
MHTSPPPPERPYFDISKYKVRNAAKEKRRKKKTKMITSKLDHLGQSPGFAPVLSKSFSALEHRS